MELLDFKGMSWRKAKGVLSENTHLLALSQDGASLEVAKTVENQGVNAGIAMLVAHLYMQQHGCLRTAKKAIAIYRDLISSLSWKKKWNAKTSELRKKIDDTEEWLWMCSGYVVRLADDDWILKPCFRKINERAGLANVMLGVSARELLTGTTTDKLAGQAILRLLSRGETKGRDK